MQNSRGDIRMDSRQWTVVLFTFCNFFLRSKVEGCSASRLDYTFSEQWGGLYKLHHAPASWLKAQQTCVREDATLATPYTTRQNEILQNLMAENNLDCGIFIGVQESLQSKGDYYTIEGTPFCQIPHEWASNEPNVSVESCAVLLPEGTFVDEPCSETLPFVCYKRGDRTCNGCRNLCKTNDTAYIFDQRTASCYKFHPSPAPWGRANQICSNEGGHLAIINSEVESRVLKEIFAEHPEETMTGATHNTVVHIGFHELFLRGDWRNVDGKTPTESGFANWSPGQPDHSGQNEHCGSIFRNGLLNDLPCDANDYFICEIEAVKPQLR